MRLCYKRSCQESVVVPLRQLVGDDGPFKPLFADHFQDLLGLERFGIAREVNKVFQHIHIFDRNAWKL